MNKTASKIMAALVMAGLASQASIANAVSIEAAMSPFEQPEQRELPMKALMFRVSSVSTVALEPLQQTNEQLQQQALNASSGAIAQPLQIGVRRDVAQTSSSEAFAQLLQWESNASDGLSAAVRFILPDAKGSRITLAVERLPASAQLRFISELTGEEITFSGEQVIDTIALAEGETNQYVGPYIGGESVILEIHLPNGYDAEDLKLSVPSISHMFVSMDDLDGFTQADPKYSCLVDSICDPSYNNESTAIAAMLYQKEQGSYICTGTLLNTKPSTFIPYFITANHCISDKTVASTLLTRWDYRNTSCGGSTTQPNASWVYGGSSMLLTNPDTDTTFLQLANKPTGNRWYLGWTADLIAKNVGIFNISHPAGEFDNKQKMARGYVSDRANCTRPNSAGNFSCNFTDSGSYSVIPYTYGMTLGGSSGSGYFVTSSDGNRYYAGTLYGGSANCANPSGNNYYGRFDLSYQAGIKKWLYPDAPTQTRQPVYRLFNTKKGTHFFTASASERDKTLARYPQYVSEGTAFYTYAKTGDQLKPVFRFYNTKTGAHFYTINALESERIRRTYPHYLPEGTGWYAATSTVQSSQPLYRFYNNKTATHFYTTSAKEKDSIIAKYKHFSYEGVAYQVWNKK